MRTILPLLTALIVVACATDPVPETEVGLRGAASEGCVNTDDWAYAVNRGQRVYEENCYYCHQDDGRGQPGKVPQLAGNNALLDDPSHGIRLIFITKNLETRTHGMSVEDLTAIFDDLNEKDVADVLTYVRASWGNCAGPVSEDDVRAVTAGM